MRKLAFVLAVLAAGPAAAADPFTVTLTIDGGTPIVRGFDNLEAMLEQFSDASLHEVSPAYTNNSAADGAINLRGLQGVFLFYDANSPVLNLHIQSLGVAEQFHGATRDESEQLLEEWFEGEGRGVLKSLLTELAATSPIDPMAGNPNSLMSTMAAADFAAASNLMETVAAVTPETPRNFFGVSARFGQYSQGAFGASVLSLPLSYTHLFERGHALSIDLPLTYVSNDGAATYSGSLGAGWRIPLAPRWSLTPGVRVGIVGSEDLGAGGLIYSTSATSNYKFDPWGKFQLGVANMLAYYWTGDVSIGDYDVGYDLQNLVTRNGLLSTLDGGFAWFAVPMEWQFGLVRTDYFGDDLYSTAANDLSVSLGSRKRVGEAVWNALRLGLTYTFGNGDISGVSANMGYTF